MEINPEALQKTLNGWAIISIDRFQENLVKMDIGGIDGELMQSFKYEVTVAGGDAWSVLIKFLKYGRFVDMNVGRGHPIGDPGNRIAKKWYSRQKTKEVAILRFIMAKQYNYQSITLLETELKNIDKIAA